MVVLTTTVGQRVTVTPGRLDADAHAAFMVGHCAALASALHRAHGWPLVGLAEDGEVVHVAVVAPDGLIVDMDGAADPDDWLQSRPDPDSATIVPLTAADLPAADHAAALVAPTFIRPVVGLWATRQRGWVAHFLCPTLALPNS
jgi:hypothetical protein